MHKLAMLILAFSLLCGCSWFGMGDDSSTTAATSTTTEPEAVVEPTPDPAPAAKSATAQTVKKTTAKKVKGAKSEEQIKAELDQMGRKLASQSSRTLLPNKANKAVKQVGGQWVASYIDVRPDEVRTQLRAGASGQYVGSIRYAEHYMECTGTTKQAALSASAPCREVRTRNMNELIRYDGKQWQD